MPAQISMTTGVFQLMNPLLEFPSWECLSHDAKLAPIARRVICLKVAMW